MKLFSRLTLGLGVIVLMGLPVRAQITNSLYFMHGVPQSNRINPAFRPQCGFYIGVPVIAPARVELASSALAYGDVIYPHPFQDSLITFLHPEGDKEAFLNLLKPVNFLVSDAGASLFSLGFNTQIGFFSLDVSTRIDGNIYYPGDLARLLINGAQNGQTYELDGIGTDLSVFEEVSAGWSQALTDNLNLGVRAKLLFGMGNFTTTSSDLSVTTSEEVWNIESDMMFNASLPFAEVQYDEEGNIEDIVINDDLENPDLMTLARYAFNTGNTGFGIDLGLDFRPAEKWQLSASLVDLGFVRWKDETHDVSYSMAYDYNGIEVDPVAFSDDYTFGDHLDSMLTQLADSLSGFLQFSPGRAYSTRLNSKLFVGASYDVSPALNLGILSRTDFLSGKIAEQVTASANFRAGRIFNFTLSYAYLNRYFKNFGAGISLNTGPFNLYAISDNVINALVWPQEAKSVNLWIGMNLVFGYKQFRNREKDRPLVY